MINFRVDTSELATVSIGIKAIETRLKEQIQEATEDGAQAAKEAMEAGVPRGETGDLARSIHIDRSGVFFHAGGLGGGGYWESEVSAGRGVPYTGAVVQGTGIYAGKGNIRPISAPRMMWKGSKLWGDPYKARKGTSKTRDGRTQHVANSTRGQPAQDKWVIAGQEAAKRVIEEKLAELDRGT